MSISTKRTMSPTEIEVPNYQLIDGTAGATVKLSTKRRKIVVE